MNSLQTLRKSSRPSPPTSSPGSPMATVPPALGGGSMSRSSSASMESSLPPPFRYIQYYGHYNLLLVASVVLYVRQPNITVYWTPKGTKWGVPKSSLSAHIAASLQGLISVLFFFDEGCAKERESQKQWLLLSVLTISCRPSSIQWRVPVTSPGVQRSNRSSWKVAGNLGAEPRRDSHPPMSPLSSTSFTAPPTHPPTTASV